MDGKPPKSVHQIRSFLGLAGYYPRFIPDFSRIAKPMTELLEKGVKFVWSEECDKAFHTLREYLTSAPMLTQPNMSKPFEVFCDASGTGLGCVLMQENRVIAYASRALRPHEKNYPTHDLELAAVVHALKIWRHYLMGNRCNIFTDHKSLKYIFTQSALNMRQRRWLELIKNYDLEVHYHPDKANVVADALSSKHCNYVTLEPYNEALCEEMMKLNLELVEHGNLYAISIKSPLHERIARAQLIDEEVQKIIQKLSEGDPKFNCFRKDDKGVVWFGQRLVIPQDRDLKKEILDEAHLSKFTIHPGSAKMYQDLRETFWWSNMKGEIAEYVSGCDTCQRIKASHLKTAGQMQPLSIPVWKWDDISMDFIVGLPLTPRKHDSIWVVVDRLTKSAHFIPVHTTYSAECYAEIYVDLIVRLLGVLKTILSDRGTQFVARFWAQVHESLGTKLIHSSSYHPQTDGQTERVKQIVEDMLRACVIHFDKAWDKCLALSEFSYNNSYQASLKMAPFEALYGRRCLTPLNWSQAGERTLFGPKRVQEAEEKVGVIRENLRADQMRQKNYHDKAKAPREFEVGNYVYLKVSPTKGVQRFGVKGKLAPRYIGPYEVTEKFGTVAYHIRLPDWLSAVHDVFHVSQLKKCEQILEAQIIEETNAEIEPDLSLVEYPMRILDQKERQTRRQRVKIYKIQ
jgi:hypothetical protein